MFPALPSFSNVLRVHPLTVIKQEEDNFYRNFHQWLMSTTSRSAVDPDKHKAVIVSRPK